ncbi:DUF4007 family protein [Mesorhizobium sp. M0496]|uniref:DUF4007 family protein n=1 Tax=Mesorhizobium sp. M0496 TaxID=2956952 RepID=UPI00333D8C72
MDTNLMRFSYGGHVTFPVRYGWLPKGLSRMRQDGAFHPSTDVGDDLGLGSKMVESLGFWLKATGLARDAEGEARTGRVPSEIADLVIAHDPYCELPGTWWFLHLALATREGTIWSWFFNDYSERIFDRAACVEGFLQFTRTRAMRPASEAMAIKDVACLLSAYGARPGVDVVDPDDVGACPFRELGLIIRHELVRRYERTRTPVGLPAEAFLACSSLLAKETGKDAVSLRELATLRFGPGRVFCAGLDAVDEMVGKAASAMWTKGVVVETLAGERYLRATIRPIEQWLRDYYFRLEAGA